jgi:prepilin-type N-terminal cleavage/methylation domain-containing protein
MLQNKQKGFTLIEILLSLGILALGLSGILTLFPVGLDAGQKAIQDTTSTLIAESLMDVLRASILQKHPDGQLPFVFEVSKLSDIPTPNSIEGNCAQGLTAYNINTDEHSLSQYSYQINITNNAQQHLYNVEIIILRNTRPIRRFYSQIMIPTN